MLLFVDRGSIGYQYWFPTFLGVKLKKQTNNVDTEQTKNNKNKHIQKTTKYTKDIWISKSKQQKTKNTHHNIFLLHLASQKRLLLMNKKSI